MFAEVKPVALPAWVGSLPLLRGGWSALLWLVPLVGYLLFLRAYLQAFALSYGLDSAAPAYKAYFAPLAGGNMLVIGLLALVLWGGVWATRCRECQDGNAHPRHLEIHYRTLLSLSAVVSVVGVFAISVFAEQDASWHQALIRDTIFTPTHIVLFFFTLPLLLVLSVTLFLYLMTRLPRIYDGGIPVAFLLALVGVAVAAAWEAANEFGHSYYFAEETFSVPIHWGFVAAGMVSVVALAVAYDVLLSLVRLKEEAATEG
ncbi:MAG: methane monooxygenase/ammonia monooxygenase subunit C [Halobacteria archaeon]